MSRFLLSCAMGAFLLTACGGSSSDSSTVASDDIADIMEPVNGTPTAVASSAITAITEGGPITVTAEGSSDPEGESLSFTWTQTEGPEIVPGGTSMEANLTITSPDVTEDTVLTFQLTTSDGTNSDTDTVSVTVEPLEAGTLVSPTAENEAFELLGLTPSATGGYTLLWERSALDDIGIGILVPRRIGLSTQDFTVDGALDGAELPSDVDLDRTIFPDGGFNPQVSAIRSGDTLYHPTTIFGTDPGVIFSGIVVGPLEGDVLVPTDANFTSDNEFTPLNCVTPIGQNQLLCLTADTPPPAGEIFTQDFSTLFAQIVQPNGSVVNSFSFTTLFDDLESLSDIEAARDVTFDTTSDDTIIIIRGNILGSDASPILLSTYTNTGTLLVDRLPVPTSTDCVNDVTFTVLENDNVFIVWETTFDTGVPFVRDGEIVEGSTVSARIIMGVIINADGSTVTEPFRVNIDEEGDHINPIIESLPNGDAVIIWEDRDEGLLARVIGPTGTPVTGEFLLRAEDELNFQDDILTTILPDGQVIVAIDEEIIAFSPVGR